MKHYDIVIIGGSVAGSTLARELDSNQKILIVEKRDLRVEPSKLIKNCGGLIAPDAQKALAKFGLSMPKDILVSPQMFCVKSIDFDNNMTRDYQRHYINVDRELFDRWLFSLVPQSVDSSFKTRFRGFTHKDDRYIVELTKDGCRFEVSCDILVGADGANSKVKKSLHPTHTPQRYVSIQEWFKLPKPIHSFGAVFDSEVSDFYSWIIPKDEYVIFGSAIKEGEDIQKLHNLQKQKLKKYGFEFGKAIKKEGCYLLRPNSSQDIYLGENSIALIGEAASFISPTSAEGISYAMLSAKELAKAINTDSQNFMQLYNKNVKYLKKNIDKKMLKYPFMYNTTIRKMIFKLRVGAL